jgi:hypothetical protein
MIKLHATCKPSHTGEILPVTMFCLSDYFKILYLLMKFESNEIKYRKCGRNILRHHSTCACRG